jgi:cytochrome c biogenesis protein CcmG/thiol:disulfide interchange protein DsbE
MTVGNDDHAIVLDEWLDRAEAPDVPDRDEGAVPPGRRPRRTRRALYGALAVGVLTAVLVAVLATRSIPTDSVVNTPLGGRPAPAVEGPDLLTGKPVDLTADRGKYVLIDFFASWCTPCRDEIPQISEFLFDHQSTVAAIGIDIDEDATDGRAFLEQFGIRWPAIEDPAGARSVALEYGVGDPPVSFLIAPDGTVVGQIDGGVKVVTLDALLAGAREHS